MSGQERLLPIIEVGYKDHSPSFILFIRYRQLSPKIIPAIKKAF